MSWSKPNPIQIQSKTFGHMTISLLAIPWLTFISLTSSDVHASVLQVWPTLLFPVLVLTITLYKLFLQTRHRPNRGLYELSMTEDVAIQIDLHSAEVAHFTHIMELLALYISTCSHSGGPVLLQQTCLLPGTLTDPPTIIPSQGHVLGGPCVTPWHQPPTWPNTVPNGDAGK